MDEICELTELIKGHCAHCRNVPTPTPERITMGPWFRASYPGECTCGASFDEGDQIRADGEGGWLAECCGGDDE